MVKLANTVVSVAIFCGFKSRSPRHFKETADSSTDRMCGYEPETFRQPPRMSPGGAGWRFAWVDCCEIKTGLWFPPSPLSLCPHVPLRAPLAQVRARLRRVRSPHNMRITCAPLFSARADFPVPASPLLFQKSVIRTLYSSGQPPTPHPPSLLYLENVVEVQFGQRSGLAR